LKNIIIVTVAFIAFCGAAHAQSWSGKASYYRGRGRMTFAAFRNPCPCDQSLQQSLGGVGGQRPGAVHQGQNHRCLDWRRRRSRFSPGRRRASHRRNRRGLASTQAFRAANVQQNNNFRCVEPSFGAPVLAAGKPSPWRGCTGVTARADRDRQRRPSPAAAPAPGPRFCNRSRCR
jgi:hypothetical protein